MTVPLTKSAFTSIEPKSQSGSAGTSYPGLEHCARAAFARRGDPQPRDACPAAQRDIWDRRLFLTIIHQRLPFQS